MRPIITTSSNYHRAKGVIVHLEKMVTLVSEILDSPLAIKRNVKLSIEVCRSQMTFRRGFDLLDNDEGAALVDYSVTSSTLLTELATRVEREF